MKTTNRKAFTLLTACAFVLIFASLGLAQKKVNFRLGWKYGPENAGYYVAIDKGYYKAEGLDVEIAQGSGSLENVKLLGVGELRVAEVDAGAVLTGRSRGIPVVSLAVLYQKLPMGLVSLKKTPLSEPKQLLRLRIGRNPKSVTSIGLDAFIRLHNLDKSQIQLVPTGWGQQPLLAGKVSAQTTYVNTDAMVLRHKGHNVNVLLFADWGLEGYGTTISVTEQALKKEAQKFGKFLMASIRGWKEAMGKFKLAAAVISKYHPDLKKDFALKVIAATKPLTVSNATRQQGLGWQTEAGWNQTQDLYLSGGLLKKRWV